MKVTPIQDADALAIVILEACSQQSPCPSGRFKVTSIVQTFPDGDVRAEAVDEQGRVLTFTTTREHLRPSR